MHDGSTVEHAGRLPGYGLETLKSPEQQDKFKNNAGNCKPITILPGHHSLQVNPWWMALPTALPTSSIGAPPDAPEPAKTAASMNARSWWSFAQQVNHARNSISLQQMVTARMAPKPTTKPTHQKRNTENKSLPTSCWSTQLIADGFPLLDLPEGAATFGMQNEEQRKPRHKTTVLDPCLWKAGEPIQDGRWVKECVIVGLNMGWENSMPPRK